MGEKGSVFINAKFWLVSDHGVLDRPVSGYETYLLGKTSTLGFPRPLDAGSWQGRVAQDSSIQALYEYSSLAHLCP